MDWDDLSIDFNFQVLLEKYIHKLLAFIFDWLIVELENDRLEGLVFLFQERFDIAQSCIFFKIKSFSLISTQEKVSLDTGTYKISIGR